MSLWVIFEHLYAEWYSTECHSTYRYLTNAMASTMQVVIILRNDRMTLNRMPIGGMTQFIMQCCSILSGKVFSDFSIEQCHSVVCLSAECRDTNSIDWSHFVEWQKCYSTQVKISLIIRNRRKFISCSAKCRYADRHSTECRGAKFPDWGHFVEHLKTELWTITKYNQQLMPQNSHLCRWHWAEVS